MIMTSLVLILLCIAPLATTRKGDGVREANDYSRAICPEVVECQPASFTGPNALMPCEDWESYNSCYRQTAEICSLDGSAEFNTAMTKKRENCMSQCQASLSFEQCDGYSTQTTTTTATSTTTTTTTRTTTTSATAAAAATPAATTTPTQSATATTPITTGQKGDNATEGVDDEGVDDDDNDDDTFSLMNLLGNSGMCLKGGYVVALIIVAANLI